MGFLILQGDDWKRITRALEAAFDVPQLSILIHQQFPNVANQVAWQQGLAAVVHDVVFKANQQGLLPRVLAAAGAARPDRLDLRALCLYYSRFSGWDVPLEDTAQSALEWLTISGHPFLGTTEMASWLVGVERQVCQVRCGQGYGSGFLVAPDLVMTCYHVVATHLQGKTPTPAGDVQVRFDYRGIQPSETPWLAIDPDWPIPCAPGSQADEPAGMADGLTVQAGELDFALLKLSRSVGLEAPQGEDQPRGWLDLSQEPPLPRLQTPVLIVQHPGSGNDVPPQMPLQISFATPGLEEFNANHTRVYYAPATRPGSSGAPVFAVVGRSLRLVALHQARGRSHGTDENLVRDNRGIPLNTIYRALSPAVRRQLIAPPARA